MENRDNKKKEPWRIIVGILAIAFIVYMWVEKDIVTLYATMPKEQAAPLIATTIAVSWVKVAAITGGILLIKWIISKFKNQVNKLEFDEENAYEIQRNSYCC